LTDIARLIANGLGLTAIVATTAVAQGNTAEVTIPARGNSAGRHGWIYTPVGYPASCASGCNLIVAFDGAMYLGAMPLPKAAIRFFIDAGAKETGGAMGGTAPSLLDAKSPPVSRASQGRLFRGLLRGSRRHAFAGYLAQTTSGRDRSAVWLEIRRSG
jgi:hypothetical protein